MKQQEIDIVRVEEPWAKAYLPDGTIVKIKLVFSKIVRNFDDDGKPCFNEDGSPAYVAFTQNVIILEAAPSSVRPSTVKS